MIAQCDGDCKLSWNKLKNLVKCKVVGTTNQINLDNRLYRKAGEFASVMNCYFIEKVENLKSNFEGR